MSKAKRTKILKTRNPMISIAKSPLFRSKLEKKLKGKASYTRKNQKTQYDEKTKKQIFASLSYCNNKN